MTRYSVSGTANPDCTVADTGEAAGEFAGQPYWSWANANGTWYLWTVFGSYVISSTPPEFASPSVWWMNGVANNVVLGTYSPQAGTSGVIDVTEYDSPVIDEHIVIEWTASGKFTVLKKAS